MASAQSGVGGTARQGLIVSPCEHCLFRLLVASDLSQPFLCDLLETVEQCSGSANIFHLFGKPFGFLFWCTGFPVHRYLTSLPGPEIFFRSAPALRYSPFLTPAAAGQGDRRRRDPQGLSLTHEGGRDKGGRG